MNEVCKDSRCLWILERVGDLFWLVMIQYPVIDEGFIASNIQCVRVLKMYSSNETEVPTSNCRIFIYPIGHVQHVFIGLYVIVFVIYFFHGSFIENLGGTEVVFPSETAQWYMGL